MNHFEEEFKASEGLKPRLEETKDPKFKGSRSLTHKWGSGMQFSQWGNDPKDTGAAKEKLMEIAKASVEIREGVRVHDRLSRMHIANRLKSISEDKFDWSTAEAMAMGSLVTEGYNVRVVGEDVERGTFS